MPELPDIEVYSKNLSKKIKEKVISNIILHKKNKVIAHKDETIDSIINSSIKNVARNGKEIEIITSNKNVLRIHLMLEGKMFLVDSSTNIKYAIFSLIFNEFKLVISDRRGWAKIELNPSPHASPDVLDDTFNIAYFLKNIEKKKRKNIKAFLLDQEVGRGIGNAYADEILYHAKISPESKCSCLDNESKISLFESIKKVLNNAIYEIEKIEPDIINEEVRTFFSVHRKDIKKTASGHIIQVKKIASKKTYFTSEQKVYC